jgi:hypothetical protein
MKRLRRVAFRGATLSFKDYLKVHKIIVTNRAPKTFYKVVLPYLLLAGSVGFLIGLIVQLLDYLY